MGRNSNSHLQPMAAQAFVKLIKLFNRVHELETDLSDEQFRTILLKTDSWLMYILQIWSEK